MTTSQGFDRLLLDWLDRDGPSDVPAAVIDRALAEARTAGQLRPALPGATFALRIGPLLPRPAPRSRLTLVLLVLGLLLATVAGALLVGQRNRNPFGTPGLIVYSVDGRLTSANPDGSDPRPVRGAARFSREPRWSPDGRRLAFWTGPDAAAPSDLVVVDGPDAAPRVVVRSIGQAFEPSWSPDSKRLVVGGDDPSLPGSGYLWNVQALLVVDADTGANHRLDTRGLNPWTPRWSPVDDVILFWGEGFSSENGLYVIGADGAGLRQVVPAEDCDDMHPYCFGWADWSSDGTRVAYSRHDTVFDVWAIGRDGTNARRLSTGTVDALNPTWSPDDSRVAWLESASAVRGGPPDGRIVVADADGSRRTVVTGAYLVPWTAPRWSPDGKAIIVPVYDPAVDGTNRLGVFPLDGGEPRVLALGGDLSSDPGWQRQP